MKTLYDFATPASLATNAACPQRPAWQISPVGYKWAQAVFGDCKQGQTRDTKKGVEAWPKPEKIWGEILLRFKQAVLVSRRQTGKLLWMSVF